MIWASIPVILQADRLDPGGRYEATFQAVGEGGDVYYLGAELPRVRRDGTVRYEIDLADLSRYVDEIAQVRIWVRPFRSVVTAPPVDTRDGLPAYVEIDLYPYGKETT